jgi:tetratricopeptide (TPR) repeat protein
MNESERNINLEKKIDAYVKGHLSEEQADKLWAQLLRQPNYISYLKTEVALAHIYQSEERRHLELLTDDGPQHQEMQKPGSTGITQWWRYAAAAAIILAAVLTSLFINNRRNNIRQWSNTQIGLAENLASAPVTRSVKPIPSPDSLLNAGFRAAINGNTQKATDIYRLVLEKYNQSKIVAKANLDLGILHYNSSKFKPSIRYFTDAIAHAGNLKLLKERAYWYMGNAYINTHQLKHAREAVISAHSIGKIYKNEESKLLKRLNHTLENQKTKNSE